MNDFQNKSSKSIRVITLLISGAILLYFSNGTRFFSIATWLFAIPFLMVSRREKRIFSFIVIPLIFGIITQLSFWKFTYDNSRSILFYIPFFAGVYYGYVFYVDAIFYPKLKGFASTLVFPLAYTSFEFLLSLFNPFGTAGLLGYTQLEFLAFSQFASLFGLWGMTFMITWFGSVLCWMFESLSDRKLIAIGGLIYFSILAAILIYGIQRIGMPLQNSYVRISGIHTHDKVVEGEKMNSSLSNKDTTKFKEISNSIISRLIEETKKEARKKSSIIVWSEISTLILDKDEDSLVNVFRNLAKEENIYLLTNPFSVGTNGAISENKILFFSPTGELVSKHIKYGGNFMEGTLEGNKTINTIATPYGNLASLICWDADFPSIVKQVGKSNADILLIPASNWKEISPLHTNVAVFRGIENGCSVLRQTRNGLSIITDSRGVIISQLDHFATNSWIMSGNIPNKKIWTLYPHIGDLFAWLAILGFVSLMLLSFYRLDLKIKKTTNFISIVVMSILFGCSSTGQLYRKEDNNKIYSGKLSDTTYNGLKQYLLASTKVKLNDTIIIKYDYNNETCWDALDQKSEDFISPFVTAHKERLRSLLAERTNVSIFDFREPGTKVNKIKKWNNSIYIDSTKYLFKLLFKKRSTCGSSIIVMPDKNYVFLRSDAHSDAMDYTKSQIQAILKK